MERKWDAIIIGSGIGGLTTAGLLAASSGKKVLLLEKHSEPGGLTHVFRRDGASWDVGLHYVGEMEEGSFIRSFMDFLSGGELKWNKMPYDFERFIYPGLDFKVPSDPLEYRKRLMTTFPLEQKAINRYFKDIQSVKVWNRMGFFGNFMPQSMSPLIRLIARITGGKATQTTEAYMEKRFKDPLLKALLTSQWGDYGLPPAQSTFAIHAMIVGHYLKGAWFPEGGSGRIARSFEKGIEAHGGKILVCQEVTSILLENGKVSGVRVIDRRGRLPQVKTYECPIVISNAGAKNTFEKLLPVDGIIGSKTEKIRKLIAGLYAGGGSCVTLYIRLKAPVSSIGVQGENFWINTDLDNNSVLKQDSCLLEGISSHIYVSFPSAKSGENRFHTAEIIANIDYIAFQAWKDKPHGNRGKDYSDLKEEISRRLLEAAEKSIPGLSALVVYQELSTPLTMENYTSHPMGRYYGLPAVPERYKSNLTGPVTPVSGLYLTGEDAGCLGIVGAMMGGVSAAAQVLGPSGFFQIMAALKGGKITPASVDHSSEKRTAVLIRNKKLAENVGELKFRLDGLVEWTPGQFARVMVAEGEWRDYSIASITGNELALLVSTRTGGKGSEYAESAEPGSATQIELPLGNYGIVENARRKIFVATGTGLAPLLSLFREFRDKNQEGQLELFFGCRTAQDDLCSHYKELVPAKTIVCLSREAAGPQYFQGRVTDALLNLDFDSENTDFYLCGSGIMVSDCRRLLEKAGARAIYVEVY